jgi:hypothetical protein
MMDFGGFLCTISLLYTFRKLLVSVFKGLEGQTIYKLNKRLEDSISVTTIVQYIILSYLSAGA